MDRVSERIERSHFIPVENETDSSTSRVTVEGRTITYRMTVLQQPVRARACGQGAKSSADRRPVDPPPIVELKIFEGEDQEHDITFTMHANYFLFATLEQARPIAHGRVSTERSVPVLTGTPVAGMVYLDRPSPAGYFIFPDLSVRHEGSYRLSFALYEDCKSPKDEDKIEDGIKSESDAHVTHRLEVKSEPFHVFSAKKFPGLTESTSLSRMVAEQGCRVRIRRDVRMRRRENKSGGKDWDSYEDETAQARARVSATPDPNGYQAGQTPRGFMDPISRPRSASNASHHSAVSRRPSVQDFTYGQSHPGTAPHTPQTGYQSSSYGPSPGQQYQSSSFSQQQASMQPPPPQYASQSYPQPPPPPPAAAAQQGYYGYSTPRTQSQSQFSAPSASYEANQPQRNGSEFSMHGSSSSDYHRNSVASYASSSQPGYSQQHGQSSYQSQQSYQAPPPPPPQPSQQSYGSSADLYHSHRPAPLEPVHPQSRNPSIAAPQPARPTFDLPPINTTIMPATKVEASSPMSSAQPSSSYFSNSHSSSEPNKRSYGNVFSNRHHVEPLRQGARPSTTYGSNPHTASLASLPVADDDDDDNDNDELDPTTLGMHYRRADGRQILRALPGHS